MSILVGQTRPTLITLWPVTSGPNGELRCVVMSDKRHDNESLRNDEICFQMPTISFPSSPAYLSIVCPHHSPHKGIQRVVQRLRD